MGKSHVDFVDLFIVIATCVIELRARCSALLQACQSTASSWQNGALRATSMTGSRRTGPKEVPRWVAGNNGLEDDMIAIDGIMALGRHIVVTSDGDLRPKIGETCVKTHPAGGCKQGQLCPQFQFRVHLCTASCHCSLSVGAFLMSQLRIYVRKANSPVASRCRSLPAFVFTVSHPFWYAVATRHAISSNQLPLYADKSG